MGVMVMPLKDLSEGLDPLLFREVRQWKELR
jgi:hypothetical protein